MRFVHQRQHLKVWVLLAIGLAAAARAQDPIPSFDIDAQDAADGLTAFSEQSHLQLLFDYDAVTGIHTQAVSGNLRVTDALSRLLTGTGLTFEVINERTISIVRDPELIDGAMKSQTPAPKPVRREAWVVNAGDEPQPDPERSGSLEEILVTAEKREEPLQRSALAVTVGVAAVAAVDPGAHGRMKKFSEDLAQAQSNGELLEYSLMVWGLTEKQLGALKTSAVRIASEPDDAP